MMRCGIRNPQKLKLRHYDVCLIDLNEYLYALPGSKESDYISEADLNEIPFNSMTNGWNNQAHLQGLYSENITFKKDVSMFEHMEISETIYEGAIEPSLPKKPLEHMLTVLITSGKRDEKPPRQKCTLRWVNALPSVSTGMYIF